MNVNRRRFLALLSFGSLGVAAIWNLLRSQATQRQASTLAVPPSTPSAESIALKNTPENALEKVLETNRSDPKDVLLLRFMAVADTGTGGEGQYAVADAMTKYHAQNPLQLVVLAGDNIYNDGEIEKISQVFEQPYKSLLQKGVKFQACLGNHDIRTDNGVPQLRYKGFNMPDRYYTFRQNAVQFFALDTNYNADWQKQLRWLDQELNRSDATWKIVFGHHQIYSSGHYGVNASLVEVLPPLFKKYGVQLYINGHDHHYERSIAINGTTYLICGSGAGTRPVGRSSSTAYSAERLGFAALDVYGDRMVIKGIGTNNSIFDTGIIPLKSA